jgi:hypothetical protein
MLSPFDIRFLRELEGFISAEIGEFRQKVSNAKDFADIKYHLGYVQALEDVLAEGAEIERRMNSSKE